MTSSRTNRTLPATALRLPGRVGWVLGLSVLLGLAAGCASPGPPRPPSLQLPEPVTDLSAQRSGDAVMLRFTLPVRSTDKTLLRLPELRGVLCRQVRPGGSCIAVKGFAEALSGAAGAKGRPGVAGAMPVRTITLKDTLPAELAEGEVRLLAYRVEVFGPQGTSAGPSDAALTAAGRAPAMLRGLRLDGVRAGVVVRWDPAGAAEMQRDAMDTVVIEREDVARAAVATKTGSRPVAAKRKGGLAGPMRTGAPDRAGVMLLDAHAGSGDETLDTGAVVGAAYRYAGYRERRVVVGGQTVTVRSVATPPVAFTLAGSYAPDAPVGLTAAGFTSEAGAFVVSLIWQPVEDAGVAGYNVYRESGAGRVKLNAVPVAVPGFEDVTAERSRGYRYSVTAVDGRGNESAAAVVAVGPR